MDNGQLKKGYKWTEVGVIPEDWEVKTISDLGSVVRGGSPRPAGDSRFFNGSYIPWLTVAALTNIPENQMVVSETFSGLTEEGAKHSRMLEVGTVIIANSGATLGVAKLLGIKCCANDGIAALINQRDGDKQFLCHFINTKTKELREVVATGNGQPNLNTSLIKKINIPFPAIEEQRAIATALSDVDALIAALDKLFAKKRAIKTATMQQLLTGKKRLPGFTAEWEIKTLGSIGSFKKGHNLPKKEIEQNGVPCVLYGEIYTKYNFVTSSLYSFVPEYIAAQSTWISKGDILFAGSGETFEDIGKCFAYLGEERACAGGDVIIFTPHEADGRFLGYLLNSPEVNKQKSNLGQGSSVIHIYHSSLETLTLQMPSLPEQRAIAAVLSAIDAEITALESRRNKTQSIKQGMMQELLTGRTRLI